MSTPKGSWADRPEERLAHDAGSRPESVEERDDGPHQVEKYAGTRAEPDLQTDVPEQIAKDAGEAPVIIEHPVDVPEQIAKDAADPDRR